MERSELDIHDVYGIPITKEGRLSLASYPSVYKDMFAATTAKIGNEPCVLLETKGKVRLRPLVKAVDVIQGDSKVPCVVISPQLSNYQKRTLSEEGIAWLSSSETFHIPFLGMASRREPRKRRRSNMSPQAFRVLAEYLSGNLDGMSTQQVAEKVGKGLSVTSGYFKELEELYPGLVGSQGRKRFLDPSLREEILDSIEKNPDLLFNSVVPPKKLYIKSDQTSDGLMAKGFVPSGLTALSSSTMIADDPWQTLAIGRKAYEKAAVMSEAVEVSQDDEPDYLVEIWPYELNDRVGKMLLPLELWLSSYDQTNTDERVAMAITELVKRNLWQ